jgi:hypothetical protein
MKLSSLLPYERCVFTTHLSQQEVLKRIDDNIQVRPNFRFSFSPPRYSKPYSGYIRANFFEMTRNISYRNSFLPLITGTVSTESGQTQVTIIMKPVLFVTIFMCIWLGFAGLVSLIVTLGALTELNRSVHTAFDPAMLIPYGMFAFGYLLFFFAFKFESGPSARFLEDLLEAKEFL